MRNIILASASPRRKELLEQIGISFQIQPAGGEEIITSTKPELIVEELSRQKAKEIALKNQIEGTLIIGADTIVTYKNQIMGKPHNEEKAAEMLAMLSGNRHRVYTGVTAILWKDGKMEETTFAEFTEVEFYPLSEKEIKEYVASGEPMDKAGAYGIQEKGAKFIKSISGDYNNVVGLPVARIYQEILSKVC